MTRGALLTGRFCCSLPLARLLLSSCGSESAGTEKRPSSFTLDILRAMCPNSQSKQKPLHHGRSALQLQPRPLTVAEHNLGATRSYDPSCKSWHARTSWSTRRDMTCIVTNQAPRRRARVMVLCVMPSILISVGVLFCFNEAEHNPHEGLKHAADQSSLASTQPL